ncbi:DNA repair protein RadC [Gangjinia marincola]|uniref:DNA repair protein RadC n=1 Tax=Gangjinia marincola TaxID=578463 RepID=A0ABN1MJX7_9FLAO
MSDSSASFSIKHWALDDRPREKLLQKGKASLSDAELIAILIGSGSRTESAVQLSQRILAKAENNLNVLGKFSVQELMKFKGIGEAKAISIVAALELGKRRAAEDVVKQSKIGSSRDAYHALEPLLSDLPHEEFWIVFLNNSNKILQKEQLSKGGITGTLVDVRLLFKRALELGATALILGHNHPSGNTSPSNEDKKITLKIKEAGEGLDIKVLDHIIVTQTSYFSFADQGLL